MNWSMAADTRAEAPLPFTTSERACFEIPSSAAKSLAVMSRWASATRNARLRSSGLRGTVDSVKRSRLRQVAPNKVRQFLTTSSPRPHADFGARLKEARLAAGHRRVKDLTKAEVARKIGVSKQAYGPYEDGVSLPDHRGQRLLAAVLGVNPAWLVWGEGEREATSIPPEVAAELERVIEAMQAAAKKPGRSKPTPRRPKSG